MTDHADGQEITTGLVKWFDPLRGFGFVVDGNGGADILLHANVLRDFGQSAVSEGSQVKIAVIPTARGFQAVRVLEVTPPAEAGPPILELSDHPGEEIAALPMQAARVKWFDRQKGFGFANLFGQPGDVFLHVEVLRRSGFADLAPGEAIALRVVDGRRGLMAAEVLAWDRALSRAGHGTA